MRKGHLSEFFTGAAAKIVSGVDASANRSRSHQHEIGTTVAMRQFLGNQNAVFQATFIWGAGEQEAIVETGEITFYNTRKLPRSPELRLYYPNNSVTESMAPGDTLIVAARPAGDLLFIVVPTDSVLRGQLLWLFGFDVQPALTFSVTIPEDSDDAAIDFAARLILDEIGIEQEDPHADKLDEIVGRFGTIFPKTAEFSALARLTLPEIDARDDPDAALMAWLTHEEAMFRRLERAVVEERLRAGFSHENGADVDGFLSFSLSVQNRRKSRMGHALENHLGAIFGALGIGFSRQVITEVGNTADFIFPSKVAYHDPLFPAARLTMLAAKATCKERWRQVLPEAGRVAGKHLATLEPGITTAQTDQIRAAGLQLVIPSPLHPSYTSAQRSWLWTIREFAALVKAREGR